MLKVFSHESQKSTVPSADQVDVLPPEPENTPESDPEASGQSGPDDQTARLDALHAQVAEAAGRFTAAKADREARAKYAARLEREAHAEPERTLQTEASYEAEIEL